MKTDTSNFREEFADKGYVILRGLLDAGTISSAREAVGSLVEKEAQKLKAAGKVKDTFSNEPFETRLYKLYENNQNEAPLQFRPELHLKGMYPVLFNKTLLDLVEQILGPEILLYPNYTSRPKYPHMKRAEVLWHQDGGYTEPGADGMSPAELRMVNVWTPLVPAHVVHGCMQFVPKSHKLGIVPHSPKPGSVFLEIDGEYLDPRRKDAINVEMDPGDVVLFHNLLFHQGLPNNSDIIRWNIDWRYLDGTQPTLRKQKGHMARSRAKAGEVVKDANDWASRNFGPLP